MKKAVFCLLCLVMTIVSCKKKSNTNPTPPSNTTAQPSSQNNQNGASKDSLNPIVSLSKPNAQSVYEQGDTITIIGAVSDDIKLKSYSMTMTIGSNIVYNKSFLDSSKSVTIKSFIYTQSINPGVFNFSLSATDSAGNKSQTKPRALTIKRKKPADSLNPVVNSISIILPPTRTLNSMFTNEIEIEVTDETGIDSIIVEVFKTRFTPAVLFGRTKILKNEISNPKSYKKIVKVALGRTTILNSPADIIVTVYDSSGNIGKKTLSTVITL